MIATRLADALKAQRAQAGLWLRLSMVRWIALATLVGTLGLALLPAPTIVPLCLSASGDLANFAALPWRMIVSALGPIQWLGHWGFMILATMSIMALPLGVHVELHSFRSQRPAMSLAFLTGYLVVWLLAGAGYLLLMVSINTFFTQGSEFRLTAFLVAFLVQILPQRTVLVTSCHRIELTSAFGLGALASSLRFGLVFGRRCLSSSWHLMLAAMVSPHHLASYAVVPVALIAERNQHSHRIWDGLVAIAVLAILSIAARIGQGF